MSREIDAATVALMAGGDRFVAAVERAYGADDHQEASRLIVAALATSLRNVMKTQQQMQLNLSLLLLAQTHPRAFTTPE